MTYLLQLMMALAVFLSPGQALAQPALSLCNAQPREPACAAPRGDRAEGWLAQSRAEVMATHGVVATSQPLAAEAGLQIMRRGGNAIDAAVAAAAVLSVVEPMNNGVAGDLFAIVYSARDKKIHTLNASGSAPSGATLAHLNELGYRANPDNWGPGSGMPPAGILTVTVPGSVWGWQEVLQRFGTRSFQEVLQPAVDYAEQGFPVSQRIAAEWDLPPALPLRRCCTRMDPDTVTTWTLGDRPPEAGEIFKNPDLARTLRLLQREGRAAFYEGEIARAIVAKSAALDGTMTLADLANYKGEWVEAAASDYKGYTVLELPPPAQAWAANEMLNILEACVPLWAPGQTLASLGPRNPLYWHLLIEAKKLAYRDLFAFNGDPNFVKVPLDRLLAKAYAQSLCAQVDPARASETGPRSNTDLAAGDTIVLTTADAEGNMVAWVNSNYASFGSGITVPGYGFVLHNRGGLFSLDPASPNVIAPGKRPFNTLAAGFVMKDAQPLMSVLLMGGDMQAQGHAQVLVDMIDLGANVQAASDIARFRHSQVVNQLGLENELYRLVGPALVQMGHRAGPINGAPVGGFQSILRMPNGVYRAGSDHRKDGAAVGW